jgi:hypothetical protein
MNIKRKLHPSARRALTTIICAALAAVPAAAFSAVGHDFNGDGKSDLIWRYQPTGFTAAWYMNGAQMSSYWYSTTDVPFLLWTSLGANDFNGDGKGDILWRSPSSDVLALWYGAQNGFTGEVIGETPAGWSVIANGDVNGDGKSDLIWRHDATGQIAYWYMNGASSIGSGTVPTNAFGLRLVGVKDLNADGRADMVWSNDTTRQLWGWISAAGQPSPGNPTPTNFNVGLIANYSSASTPFALGDVTADGRADIYWRYPAAQQFGYWQMSGTTVQNQTVVSTPLPSDHVFVNTGDYNGDGRDDIVWNDVGTGLFLWKCACNGFTPELIVDYPSPSIPAGWVPVL